MENFEINFYKETIILASHGNSLIDVCNKLRKHSGLESKQGILNTY